MYPTIRDWLLSIVPLVIMLYFLFHHEHFMKAVGWLATLVRDPDDHNEQNGDDKNPGHGNPRCQPASP